MSGVDGRSSATSPAGAAAGCRPRRATRDARPPKTRNGLAACIAIALTIVLLVGVLVVARSRPTHVAVHVDTSPYRPRLDAAGDPRFVATGLRIPKPSSEPLPAVLTAPPVGRTVVASHASYVSFLVFTRASAGAPWLLALDGTGLATFAGR